MRPEDPSSRARPPRVGRTCNAGKSIVLPKKLRVGWEHEEVATVATGVVVVDIQVDIATE